jgi:diguanylate cyclase (GGDEF)-like protein
MQQLADQHRSVDFTQHRAISIRASLALLVTGCVLPGSLLAAFMIFDNYDVQRQQLTRDTIATARAMVATLDRDLASVESGLHVLAASPQLISGDLAGFHRHAKEALFSQNSFNYVLIDAAGRQQLNTLRPYGTPLPERSAFRQAQQVFATNATAVSDIFIGPVSGKPTLAMAVPVHRNGAIVYALSVGISPDRVAEVLLKQRLPAGWIGAALDQSGTMIARTHLMARFVGKKGVPALVNAARTSTEGTVESLTLEGIPVLIAFSRSNVSNWTVAVGIPKSTLTDSLQKSIWLLTGTTAALLFGVLWIAWQRGNRIAKSIRGLIAPALALGSGEPLMIPSLHLREADEVGQALIAASNMLQKAQHDAHFDVLTGLANRALFHQLLNQQMAACIRDGSQLAVLYLDLDGFKSVNDLYGHAVGDDLLRAVATRIKDGIRSADVAARFGGDEFVILLTQSGAESSRTVAEKLIACLAEPHHLSDLDMHVTASIGLAVFPDSAASSEDLLYRADAAMYEAKKTGKCRYVVAAPAAQYAA